MSRRGTRLVTRKNFTSSRKLRFRVYALLLLLATLGVVYVQRSYTSRDSYDEASGSGNDAAAYPLRKGEDLSLISKKKKIECRSWSELDLLPSRSKSDAMFDRGLPLIEPNASSAWALTITEDMNYDWLGIHNFNKKYAYGSEEADQRHQRNGYCKIHMPSIPRAGSSWFRTMFEVATGRVSTSVWPEGGVQDTTRRYFMSHDPCGAHPDQLEGAKEGKQSYPCRNVTLPLETDPVLMKSHTPFYPSYDRQSVNPSATCAILLIVRNPLDTHDAWRRYAGNEAKKLRDFLPMWSGHLLYWIANTYDLPLFIFRYEDMLFRSNEVLEMILSHIGPGWTWSRESIANALNSYGPKEPFNKKCGKYITKYTTEEVDMVTSHYSGILKHFGYNFEKREQA